VEAHSSTSLAERKAALRRSMLALRREQIEKDPLSEQLALQLAALREYQAASMVMFYVAARSEVRTRSTIQMAIASGKTVVTPQCVGDELVPWRIDSLDELVVGAFGIPEIAPHLRSESARKIEPATIDLLIVPGVAFDRRGQRLGSGRGFYDRFIPRLRCDATLVGLALDCQIVDAVPSAAHDVPMHIVITPSEVIRTRT
jgi:5-formyltetrahydrofolate cyclo-ligase